MYKFIPVIFTLLILSSCGQRPLTALVSSSSPDGKTQLTVSGKRALTMDPFTVTMEVKTNNNVDGSLQFEVAATSLDSTNVKFAWKDSQNCLITFIYTDGEKRVFRYYATATNVILQEEKNN